MMDTDKVSIELRFEDFQGAMEANPQMQAAVVNSALTRMVRERDKIITDLEAKIATLESPSGNGVVTNPNEFARQTAGT